MELQEPIAKSTEDILKLPSNCRLSYADDLSRHVSVFVVQFANEDSMKTWEKKEYFLKMQSLDKKKARVLQNELLDDASSEIRTHWQPKVKYQFATHHSLREYLIQLQDCHPVMIQFSKPRIPQKENSSQSTSSEQMLPEENLTNKQQQLLSGPDLDLLLKIQENHGELQTLMQNPSYRPSLERDFEVYNRKAIEASEKRKGLLMAEIRQAVLLHRKTIPSILKQWEGLSDYNWRLQQIFGDLYQEISTFGEKIGINVFSSSTQGMLIEEPQIPLADQMLKQENVLLLESELISPKSCSKKADDDVDADDDDDEDEISHTESVPSKTSKRSKTNKIQKAIELANDGREWIQRFDKRKENVQTKPQEDEDNELEKTGLPMKKRKQ